MPYIVTWYREQDLAPFGRVFTLFPEVRIGDAARETVDIEAANGLLLVGGSDISAPYLRQPIPNPSPIDLDITPDRDAWEFAALKRAFERGIPVMGVCRGHQILNVMMGGTLHLDIPGHRDKEMIRNSIQPLRYEADAPLSPRCETVNSSHHQAIDQLAPGLCIEARAAADGIVEQVRGTGTQFLRGVQFHPEHDPEYYKALFSEFVTAVKDSMKRGVRADADLAATR